MEEKLEFKGTKGEWYMPHLSDDNAKCNCPFVLCDSLHSSIGTIKVIELEVLPEQEKGTSFENEYPTLEEAKANGKLIAAAPDLLKAIQGLLSITSDSDGVSGYHLNGRTAYWDDFNEVSEAKQAIEKALK
jgi:hypothetical protein